MSQVSGSQHVKNDRFRRPKLFARLTRPGGLTKVRRTRATITAAMLIYRATPDATLAIARITEEGKEGEGRTAAPIYPSFHHVDDE